MEHVRVVGRASQSVMTEATRMTVSKPMEGMSNYVVNRIFVAGFDRQTTTNELEAIFQTFGEILDTNIIRSKVERPFGFVTFNRRCCCESVVKIKDNHDIRIRGKKLQINSAWYSPKKSMLRPPSAPAVMTLPESSGVYSPHPPNVMCTVYNGTTFFYQFPPHHFGQEVFQALLPAQPIVPSLHPKFPEIFPSSNTFTAYPVMPKFPAIWTPQPIQIPNLKEHLIYNEEVPNKLEI